MAPLFFIHSFIFLCFLHGLHFLCVSLKYSYFYVFSANVILFSNISNWVISSTLMVVILSHFYANDSIYRQVWTHSEIQSSISSAVDASPFECSQDNSTYHIQNKRIFLPNVHVTWSPVFQINVIIHLVTKSRNLDITTNSSIFVTTTQSVKLQNKFIITSR